MSTNKVFEWQGLIVNDIVKVENEKGVFKFLSANVDADGIAQWVNVYGGTKQREKMRSFAPERIIMPSEKVLLKQREVHNTTKGQQ